MRWCEEEGAGRGEAEDAADEGVEEEEEEEEEDEEDEEEAAEESAELEVKEEVGREEEGASRCSSAQAKRSSACCWAGASSNGLNGRTDEQRGSRTV